MHNEVNQGKEIQSLRHNYSERHADWRKVKPYSKTKQNSTSTTSPVDFRTEKNNFAY